MPPWPIPSARHRFVVCLKAFWLGMPAAAIAAVGVAYGVWWLIAPECEPDDWFCGFDEALLSNLAGLIGAVAVYTVVVRGMVRRWLPPGHRRGPAMWLALAFPVAATVLLASVIYAV